VCSLGPFEASALMATSPRKEERCVQKIILQVFQTYHCKYFYVSESNNANFTELIFSSNSFKWPSPAWQLTQKQQDQHKHFIR